MNVLSIKATAAITTIALAFGLTGCAVPTPSAPAATAAPTVAPTEAAPTRTVSHALGETQVPLKPARIASLSPATTDNLLALGITPAAVTTFNGVDFTDYEYLAEPLKGAEIIGRLAEPNLEKLAAVKPDLIIGRDTDHAKNYDKLSAIAPTVLIKDAGGDFKAWLMATADAAGVDDATAEARYAEYEKKAVESSEAIRAVIGDATVAFVRFAPDNIRLYGDDRLGGKILYRDLKLGMPPLVKDLALGKNYAEVSLEQLPRLNADHIFLLDQSKDKSPASSEVWQAIPAVKAGRVYPASRDIWINTGLIAAESVIESVTQALAGASAQTAGGDAKTIVDIAIAAGNFKTLVAAAQAAGLVDVLKGAGPFTVFAPTDEAFAKLDKAMLDDLLKPANQDKLVAILTYHAVPGKVMAADVVKLSSAKTVQGEEIAIKVEGDAVMINNAKVVQADITAGNGVIHVIDTVLMPPTTGGQVALAEASGPVVVKDVNGNDVEIKDASRIVSLGGPVTEIVFALGAGDRVVGVDTSSTYPKDAVEALPKVGYQRRLAAEGVLSLKPTLVLATDQAGPPEAIQQLRDSGVTVLILKAEESVEGAKAKIMGFGQALGKTAEAEALIKQLDEDIEQANALLKQVQSQPKVMFIYARGAGTAQVAGTNTGAHAMIELAGAKNAVTEYERYKPLTAEAAVAAAPDVILMLSGGLESVGGVDGLLKEPGIAQTPAGQNKRIVDMDDEYLLSFGPRMGKAVIDLIYLMHPELKR